ncbi:hypothetical protein BS78_01G035100 [Paspalum vaginatum]|nr:hypothetical protein BS78_01G035100 [Paspalum vaginatum]
MYKCITRLSAELYCIAYCTTGLFSLPGNNDSCRKQDQGMVKSVLSFGSPEGAFPPQKFDYSQPFACASYTSDSYYGGILTGYTSNAIGMVNQIYS